MRPSPADTGLLHELVGVSDSVELKLAMSEKAGRRALTRLGIDLLDAQPLEVFYLDTHDLALDAAGIIVRVRRSQDAKDDSVVKLRPAVPDELDAEGYRHKGFKVEVDVTPASFVCSASLKARPADGTVTDAVAGRTPVSSMFTPHQRQFFAEHAPGGVTLDDLCVFGPVAVLKRTYTTAGLGHALTVESWTFPAAPGLLELSTRIPANEASEAMAQWREFLTAHHVPASDYGWTKTETALAILSGQAHRCGVLTESVRQLGRASGPGCAEPGGVVHENGKHRVERGRIPEGPGRDQRALHRRHDDFGEFPRAGAVHSEEGRAQLYADTAAARNVAG